MNRRDSYQEHAEFTTFYFGEEDQWKDVFNDVLGVSEGKENKTPFFLLVGEEGLGKKKLFEKICFELSTSGLPFQASDQIDMADKDKNPADYVKGLQEKKNHFQLSEVTVSFGVPLLKFLSPLAVDCKVDLSKSPDTPKDEPIQNLKNSRLWQVLDQVSEEKLLFIHIAHFEDCFEPWFSFLNHYLRHIRNRNKKIVILASLNWASEPSHLRHSSRLVSFLKKLDDSGLKKKVQLKALNEARLRNCIDQKFNPNTFCEDFYHTLLTITSGRGTYVSEIIKILNHDEAFIENIKSMRWDLGENWEASLDPYLPERFDEMVERNIAEGSANVKKETVFLFLSLGALVGNTFPVEPVLKAMNREKGAFDTEALLDIVDAVFCEASPKVLEDLGFKGHIFENSDGSIAIYRFNNRIMHAYFLNRLFDEKIVYGNFLGDFLEACFPEIPKALWPIIRDLYHAGRNDQKEGYYQRMIDWDLPEVTFNLLQNELREHIDTGDFKSRELHFNGLSHLLEKREEEWHAGTLLGIVKILEWLWDDFSNRGTYGWVLYIKSTLLRQLGFMVEALQSADSSLFIFRVIGNRQMEGVILTQIADIHWDKRVHTEAMRCYEEAFKIARGAGDKRQEGAILRKVANIHLHKQAYTEAMSCSQDALKIAREVEGMSSEGVILSMIGRIHCHQKAYMEAMACYKVSLGIARKLKQRFNEGMILSEIGDIQKAKEEFSEAMACYEVSLEIARKVGNRGSEMSCLSKIGQIHEKKEEYAKAMACYEAALKIALKIEDKYNERDSLCGIGNVYLRKGAYAKTITFYEQALKIDREIGDRPDEKLILSILGMLQKRCGNKKKAGKFFRLAEKIDAELKKSDLSK